MPVAEVEEQISLRNGDAAAHASAVRDDAAAALESTPPAPAAEAPPLPFAFARRFGVVVMRDAELPDVLTVACKAAPSLATLAEVKRATGMRLAVRVVPDSEFEELLTAVYMRDA